MNKPAEPEKGLSYRDAGVDIDAGNELVERIMGEVIPTDLLQELGGKDELNMTMLALNLSHFVNGTAHIFVTKIHMHWLRRYQADNVRSIAELVYAGNVIWEAVKEVISMYSGIGRHTAVCDQTFNAGLPWADEPGMCGTH